MKFLMSIIILSSTIAFAQESTPLQTIQVQGNKENKTYEESTESISVVPSKQLDSPMQTDSVQALNALPNISVNRNDNTFSIRGVNNTGVTGYAKDNVSSIIVDDVFQTDLAIKAGSIELWDINHVEVYRGPQSTSQGVNSLAGSILLFHNKPAEQTEGAVKLGYGSFNKQELGAMTNNVWFDGKVLSRITYNKEKSDGYIKNLARDNSKWGSKDKDYLNLDLVFNITDNSYIRVNSKLMQTDNGGIYVQSSNPFDYEVNEDVDFSTHTKNNQTSIRYVGKFGERWSNEVITAYSISRNDETSDADGSPQPTAGTRYETHVDSFYSVENLLKYQSERFKNVLGFHAHQFDLMDDDQFNLLFPVPTTTLITPVATRQKSDKDRTVLAVFDSALIKFTPSQSLNLGLRYEYVKNKYGAAVSATRTQNLGGANATIDAYLAQRSGAYDNTNYNSVLLPKAAYAIELNNHTLGAFFSQGYRTGGISINRSQAKTDEYSPETTSNYELSYKYTRENIRLSSNVFYTNWKDQQVLIYLSADTFNSQVQNAAASELYGAEAEAQVDLNPQHSLGVSGGYVMTRFNNFVNRNVDYGGNQFPFAPNWTGRGFYTYNINESWTASSILRYLGKSYTNADNTREAPEQFYLDAEAQYLLPSLSLVTNFYVKNVLDSEYLIYDGRPLSANSTIQANYHQVNAPQEFGVRVTYMW